MVQGQVSLKGRSWHFSYLVFSRFIIFTFRNYFKQMKCWVWAKKQDRWSCNFKKLQDKCFAKEKFASQKLLITTNTKALVLN